MLAFSRCNFILRELNGFSLGRSLLLRGTLTIEFLFFLALDVLGGSIRPVEEGLARLLDEPWELDCLFPRTPSLWTVMEVVRLRMVMVWLTKPLG